MLVNEAIQLASFLDLISPRSILDIGSATRADREIVQPHIYAAYRGHNVYWTDQLAVPGVRYCDLTDRASLAVLPRCDLVTCCSMLEHVTDIDGALVNLATLVDEWLIVSVPHIFPEHHCPIDNGWRPTPNELGDKLVALGLEVAEAALTIPETFWGIAGVCVSMAVAKREPTEERDAGKMA